jgi:hypothetical protein
VLELHDSPEVSLTTQEQEPFSAETSETDWHSGNGEAPDDQAQAALQLTHRAIAKFPELSKRYKWFIGTAAVVAPALIALASIAVTKRLHRGQSPDKILEEITPDEIESAGRERPKKPKGSNKNGRFLH